MQHELFKHRLAYSILLAALVLFIFGFMVVWPNHVQQRMLIAAIAIFYFIWGVVTHVKSESFSRRVMFEYAGVAFLASMLLLLVTL